MTPDEFRARFPEASEDTVRLNSTPVGQGQANLPDGTAGAAPKLERHPRDGRVGKVPVQEATGGKLYVRITAIRKRLLDEDNLCEKYLVDLLRYSGIIPSDAPGKAKIECCQEKAEPGAEEFIRIEVFEI